MLLRGLFKDWKEPKANAVTATLLLYMLPETSKSQGQFVHIREWSHTLSHAWVLKNAWGYLSDIYAISECIYLFLKNSNFKKWKGLKSNEWAFRLSGSHWASMCFNWLTYRNINSMWNTHKMLLFPQTHDLLPGVSSVAGLKVHIVLPLLDILQVCAFWPVLDMCGTFSRPSR